MALLVAFSIVGGTALGDELPHRKPGLWEIVTTDAASKRAPMIQRMCLDRETDALLNKMGMSAGQQACAKNDVHVSGNRVTVHAVCDMGSTQLTSDGVITYSGDSSYRNEMHGKFQPPMAGLAETHTVQEGKWTGACPADMKPGDVVMSQGPGGREMKMNLRSMLGAPH